MNTDLYKMIYKRKSFHLFRGLGSARITPEELDDIRAAYASFDTLDPSIRTALRIVPAEQIGFRRDAEYCLLLYSAEAPNHLMNIGYIGEQLDLYLVSRNIGTLWYGIGKPDEPAFDGLSFVIMIAIHKVSDETKFRKDMFKSKRKPLEEIWTGDTMGVAEVARFAPSACNSQPWFVENADGRLTVSRYRKPGKRGIMPLVSVSYYNRVDIGIFLCILELCLMEKGIGINRTLFVDEGGDAEYMKVAEYIME